MMYRDEQARQQLARGIREITAQAQLCSSE